MLSRILLLCDSVERPFLTDTLRAASAEIEIKHLTGVPALAALDAALLKDARLVSFDVAQSLPPEALTALGHNAYNFHPGTPAYPGWTPAAFAAYEGATEFGATAHAISAAQDGGVIIGTDTFPVPRGTTRGELARGAYMSMLSLFRRLAAALATRPTALPTLSVTWAARRTSRALFADLCDIPVTIDEAELKRRIHGLGGGDGYSSPTVWLHGVPFRFSPPTEPAV